MDALRTPDDCFENLEGYPFEPKYVEISDGLRMHYVDEGRRDAEYTVLMLHGEPSWSYLYRKMIPIIADAGHRAVAPDLIGFGRSDKLAARTDYTYARHVGWMTEFLEHLDLRELVLVCQDWGALIGLRVLAENPKRFARLVVGNGFLPTGEGKVGDAFLAWQNYSQTTPNFHVGGIINGGCVTDLSGQVIAAYDAPFPDDTYKEAARQFPILVPTSPDDPAAPANRAAWEVLEKLDIPVLTAFSDSDPITRGGDRAIQSRMPGAKDQPHTTIVGAGHFLQEDKGEELAEVIVNWLS
jgi:haloalkane dehalogenase